MTVLALALYNKTKCICRSRIRISELFEFLSIESKADHTAGQIHLKTCFRRRVIFSSTKKRGLGAEPHSLSDFFCHFEIKNAYICVDFLKLLLAYAGT